MGGVCPCLAGAEKAVADVKPAAKAPPATAAEKEPLISKAPPAAAAKKEPPQAAAKPELVPAQAPATANRASTVTDPVAPPTQSFTAPAVDGPEGGGISEPLEIGSCVEVYSNSYNSWCPGVVYGLDQGAILVGYQVPGEPVDANISTKTVALDSTELRLPTDTGSWLTASVEVYSHSNKAWCLGKVREVNAQVLSVVFFYPNEPPDSIPVMKQLPLGDKDLRLRGIDAAVQYSTAGDGHDTLQVHSAVEVYSNSLQVWCAGIIQELNDGVATVAFYYPDQDPSTESPAVKEMPLGHQDLRLPGYETGAQYNAGPPVTEAELVVGEVLEVYSQSRQMWISSHIKGVADGMVTVLLRYPDMPEDSELYEKVLAIGQGDMRLATGSSA